MKPALGWLGPHLLVWTLWQRKNLALPGIYTLEKLPN
jgi:hypothetical protein